MPPCVCSARSAASNAASAHRYLAVLASRAQGLPLSYSQVAFRSISSAASKLAKESASGNWMSLVHADRPAEHLALVGVSNGRAQCGAADAERLGSDQAALGVQAVEDVA